MRLPHLHLLHKLDPELSIFHIKCHHEVFDILSDITVEHVCFGEVADVAAGGVAEVGLALGLNVAHPVGEGFISVM